MKTKISILLIVMFVIPVKSYSQLTFGVSPGLSLNSAYFGYNINGKLVPYVGFQYLNAKFSSEETGEVTDWDINQIVPYSELINFSGSLLLPNIGLKLFVKEKNNIHAYFSANFSKPIIFGELKFDDVAEEEIADIVKNTHLWGGEFGFGVEYFFDNNFSLGGEFGLRYIQLKNYDSHEEQVFDAYTAEYRNTTIENEIKLTGSPTYSKISLNYYF